MANSSVTVADYLRSRIDSASFIEEIHKEFSALSENPRYHANVRQALDYLVESRLDFITGSPSDWFNLAVEARRVNNYTAARHVLEEATKRYPDDVDLLCELLQFQYGNRAQADETWQRLRSMDVDQVSGYWRYWVYGATYLARYLHDQKAALELLETGLLRVRFADLQNVLGHYRIVLLDGDTLLSTHTPEQMAQRYREYLGIIEERYKLGLELGVECGYVLAVSLARLLRERTASSWEGSANTINEALHYLDLAERAYTHDPNHPIWDIYIEKAITLMAARRYADALQVLRSLPEHKLDEQLMTMARYAANLTGQEFVSPAAAREAPIDRLDNLSQRIDQVEGMLQQLLASITDTSSERD
jgi:tetratricopeptide (TPR) repeat protein